MMSLHLGPQKPRSRLSCLKNLKTFFYLVRLNTRHADFFFLIVRIVSNERQLAGTPAKLTQLVWIMRGLVWYRKVLTRGKVSSEQHKRGTVAAKNFKSQLMML